ncbi:hypothetical protein [Rhizosaccharibacter radicis]|uniref:Uncharacterized protein n=1 Tax=Rhizosaccharibacter radicis TaxID=2782605 RepID=A0ABT1VSG9_9PROT|nr:hypothetical protein [Acetobacteraceae bacterium KSS12]
MIRPARSLTLLILLAASGCGAVGDIDTGAMQTTNRLVGAPPNGPANPPPPPPQSGM